MRKHIRALDGVRGLAIAGVLAIHFFANFEPVNAFERLMITVAGRGNLGVELFFVLSGFLITGILAANKDADPHFFKNFYMRRTLRIFPLYYAVLLVLFGILPFIPYFQGPTLDLMESQQGWAWLYGINFLVASEGVWNPPYISHFWSLAVEEHFYFIWPIAVYYLSRKNLIRFSIAMILGSLALALLLVQQNVNPLALYTLTPVKMGGLCLGGLLAVTMQGDIKRKAWLLFAGAVIGKLAILGVNALVPSADPYLEPLRTLSWDLLFGALVLAAVTVSEASWSGRLLTVSPLLFLGRYSYGLYVFHHFLSWGSEQHGGLAWVQSWVPHHTLAVLLHGTLGIVLSIIVAYASFHLFEKHFLKLKARFS